ncbi:multidrug efflux system [uncultured Alphaproteobacteria bacterium]|uniref:Multidrug efflux system n=1 Tax=uncultured Alphaproteobacteria bacterium TaxID=91750 RepID=A0A212KJK0_9PROT|nr:multidrug efflux system [uncultured Alphaproteobacteria bacterium]
MVTFPDALRPRAGFLRASSLAALVAVVLLGGCKDETKPQQAPPPPGVGVVTVHARPVTLTAELPGRTAASLVAEVRPQVDGIIRERLFAEGGEVKAGEVLYRIDASRYQAAYDAAQAALHQAEAAVPSAAARVERYKKLAQANAVSRQDLEDAEATLKANRAAVAAARAEVESALINLDYTDITAPIAGRIDRSIYTQGALVTASQSAALTTIRKLDPIHVDVTQSSADLLRLRQAVASGRIKRVGESIEVRLRLEDGSIYAHPGALAFAEANVSETTGTYILRATFPNPERLLLPGMYVHAIVAEGVAERGILVPQRGVSRNLKGEPIAMVVGADNKVQVRVLGIARSLGNDWLVESGLADGDRVIVSGSQKARAGAAVTPEAMVVDPATGEAKKADQPAPVKG